MIPGPHLHVELSFGKILNKLLLMAFSLVRVSEWLCIGRAVSLVMSRLEPCMAASAVSIWMCVWLSECDKCCKIDDLLDKCFMFVTTDHKIHEFSFKEKLKNICLDSFIRTWLEVIRPQKWNYMFKTLVHGMMRWDDNNTVFINIRRCRWSE